MCVYDPYKVGIAGCLKFLQIGQCCVGFGFESGEGIIPEPIEPLADRTQPCRIDAIDAPRAFGVVAHEPRLLQSL